VTGNLVLLDSGHELRQLYCGDGVRPTPPVALNFVEALASVAPQYDALHVPWSGAFHASDHGLLFDAAAAVTHVVMLPLPRERAVRGVYNLGGTGSMPPLAALEPMWLEHVTARSRRHWSGCSIGRACCARVSSIHSRAGTVVSTCARECARKLRVPTAMAARDVHGGRCRCHAGHQ
jgi:hypothetical protein